MGSKNILKKVKKLDKARAHFLSSEGLVLVYWYIGTGICIGTGTGIGIGTGIGTGIGIGILV